MNTYIYEKGNEKMELEVYTGGWRKTGEKKVSTFEEFKKILNKFEPKEIYSLKVETESEKIERSYLELFKKTGLICYKNSKSEIYMNHKTLEIAINGKEISPLFFDFPNSERLKILSKEELEYAKNFQRIFYELKESAYSSEPVHFKTGENYIETLSERKMYYFSPTGTIEGEYQKVEDYVNGFFYKKVLQFAAFNEKKEKFEYLREPDRIFETSFDLQMKMAKFKFFPYKGKMVLKEGEIKLIFYRNGKIKVYRNDEFLFTMKPSKWMFGGISSRIKDEAEQKEMLKKVLRIMKKLYECFVHDILFETFHCLERKIEGKLPDFILKIQEQERKAKEREEEARKRENAKPQVLKDFEKKLEEFYK